MTGNEVAELLSKRHEVLKNSPKSADRRKKKKKVWKNAYAEIVFEYFEQIDELVKVGDTIYSLFEFFQDSGFFTRDANYTFFDRAFLREKRRREKPREKPQDRKIQSPRFVGDDGDNEGSIKPRKDRKEF